MANINDNNIIQFDSNTLTAKTINEIHTMLLRNISEIYNEEVSDDGWDADAIYQKVLATYFNKFAQVAEEAFNMLNIDYASGSKLEDLVSILGVRRFGNTYARIRCRVNYTPEVNIPVGSILTFTDALGRNWYLIDGNITTSQKPLTGSVNLQDPQTYIAQDYGEITVSSIGTNFINGAIVNYNAANPSAVPLSVSAFTISDLIMINSGSRIESDQSLRTRFKTMDVTDLSSNTLEGSIVSNIISQFSKVGDVMVLNNPANDITIPIINMVDTESADDVTLNKHNVAVLLKVKKDFNLIASELQSILTLIRNKLPLGISTENDATWGSSLEGKYHEQIYFVDGNNTVKRKVSLVRVDEISPAIVIKLSTAIVDTDALTDIKNRIKNVLENFSRSFKIGQKIIIDDLKYQIRISNTDLSNIVYTASSIKINGEEQDFDVNFRYWEISDGNITFE